MNKIEQLRPQNNEKQCQFQKMEKIEKGHFQRILTKYLLSTVQKRWKREVS